MRFSFGLQNMWLNLCTNTSATKNKNWSLCGKVEKIDRIFFSNLLFSRVFLRVLMRETYNWWWTDDLKTLITFCIELFFSFSKNFKFTTERIERRLKSNEVDERVFWKCKNMKTERRNFLLCNCAKRERKHKAILRFMMMIFVHLNWNATTCFSSIFTVNFIFDGFYQLPTVHKDILSPPKWSRWTCVIWWTSM